MKLTCLFCIDRLSIHLPSQQLLQHDCFGDSVDRLTRIQRIGSFFHLQPVSGFCDSHYGFKPLMLLYPTRYANRDEIFELPLTLYNISLSESTL